MKIPKHVAIIMDGNGRWAEKRHLPKTAGHIAGAESVRRAVRTCVKLGIEYLTVYAFSSENWKRPKKEISAIFGLFSKFLDNEIRDFHKNEIRLCVIGDRGKIEERLRKKMEQAEKDTADYKKLTVNVALSYGSRQEILNAVRLLARDVKKEKIEEKDIDEELFSSYLYTKNCPDPDLLIRTSGEMRISNFLLWQISYSELYVTNKLWPDFREADFKKAIEDYSNRDRRYGGR